VPREQLTFRRLQLLWPASEGATVELNRTFAEDAAVELDGTLAVTPAKAGAQRLP
jgi:hypothetical protein